MIRSEIVTIRHEQKDIWLCALFRTPKSALVSVVIGRRLQLSHSPSISIIIPVYNVKPWLRRAVNSLQNQTFRSYEILLVDDGSTDGSAELCDLLADYDMRIRVIHQENAGAASARNAAIAIARGTYLYFMDGDDWCDPEMLSDMYSAAAEHDLDLLVTGFTIDTYYDNEGRYYRELRNAPNKIFASREEFRNEAYKLFDAQLLYAPWNKLYRREYLDKHNLRFPTTFWDDLPFNLEVMRDVERIGCLDGHYYHFLRARAESENTKYRADMYDKREEEHQWMKELFEYWGIDTPEVREFLARRYAERLVGCIENITNRNCTLSSEEKRAAIRAMISTPQAREALKLAKPRTKMMGVVLCPLKMGNVNLTMMQSSVISWVRQNSTNLFARLKANR